MVALRLLRHHGVHVYEILLASIQQRLETRLPAQLASFVDDTVHCALDCACARLVALRLSLDTCLSLGMLKTWAASELVARVQHATTERSQLTGGETWRRRRPCFGGYRRGYRRNVELFPAIPNYLVLVVVCLVCGIVYQPLDRAGF